MSFDHPRLVLFGHHPLGARTRYLLLTAVVSPLLAFLPGDERRAWREGFQALRGRP